MEDRRSDLKPASALPQKPARHSSGKWTSFLLALLLMAAGGSPAAGQSKRPLDLRIDASYREEIGFGASGSFEGVIANRSLRELENVRITAGAPEGWTIRIVPDRVATLGPGEAASFVLSITPRRSLFREEHRIVVAARSGAVADDHTFVAAADPRGIWISAAAVLVAAVAVAFWLVFRRLNKG